MDDDGDVLAARPTPLVEVRPQPGVLRHTGAHIVDFSPFVQILDDPVPQMGGTGGRIHEEARCAGVGRAGYRRAQVLFLTGSRNAVRVLVRAGRTSWWKCLRSYRTLPCSSGLSNRSLTFQFLRVGLGGGGLGGLQGVSQRQGSTAFSGADHVDIPVPHGRGLQGFLPGQGSTASSSSSHVRAGAVDEPFQGFFRTFPRLKKSAGLGPHSGSDWVRTLLHGLRRLMSSPWRALTTSLRRSRRRRVVVEEGAVTRFAAGFRPLRVCMRFLEHQLGRPVRGCAYGDRCTFAHSWAELHPEASAHERELASYFPD